MIKFVALVALSLGLGTAYVVMNAGDNAQAPAPAIDFSSSAAIAPPASEIAAPRLFSSSQPLIAPTEPRHAAATAQAGTYPSPIKPLPENPRRLSSLKPADEDTRQALVRDLQRELKRVGCYESELNGHWGAASKRAMAAFMERVNATLPMDEPDYILLTLVQGHAAEVCGQACPAGQGLNAQGKCLPRAILAQNAKRSKDKTIVASVEPAQARIPAGEPKLRPQGLPIATGQPADSWSAVVAEPASPPLPGRMAIGAPLGSPIGQPPAVAALPKAVKAPRAPHRIAVYVPRRYYAPDRRRWTRTIFSELSRR